MKYYALQLNETSPMDATWDMLTNAGFQLLYSDEVPPGGHQKGKKMIYGHLPAKLTSDEILNQYPQIASIEQIEFDQIDWHAQWGISDESPSIYFDLAEYSTCSVEGFTMIPGPGFGDLSHPTTRLVVRLMAPLVQGKYVIDLGCGSGVLSLAAVKLGAVGACGIDIEDDALQHAKANAKLNGLEQHCHFQLPTTPLQIPSHTPLILVMNMISSEQEQAWQSMPALHSLSMFCITSGLLRTQADQYIEACQSRGWQLIDCTHEEEWCGFIFQRWV